MHRSFASVVAPLIEALQPRTIVETGAGAGRLTKRALAAPGARTAVLHAIDPSPRLDPRLPEESGGRLRVHAERSVSVIGRLGPVDLALLDSDPNWYTVSSELTMLELSAERADRAAPVVVVHHVHWPYGRRDGYHDPAAIPEAERRAHSQLGLVPGHREPRPGGLRLVPACAERDFEPRSGVMTGIEDAIAASTRDWRIAEIPGFHGVAVLADARVLEENPALGSVFRRLRSARFLGGQARQAELARLAVEVEAAALRQGVSAGPPEAFVESDAPLPATDAPAAADVETSTVLAELAEHRARRGALEWQLKRLEEDLASRSVQIKELSAERDEERKAAAEAAILLEGMRQRLDIEREAAEGMRSRVSELEEQADGRARELRDAVEREQLAQGRLAHRQDALQAAEADSERLRGELERVGDELRMARTQLDEVAEHLRTAGMTRRARVGRRMARLIRLVSLRREPRPNHLDAALAAAERDPGPLSEAAEIADPRQRAAESLDASRG